MLKSFVFIQCTDRQISDQLALASLVLSQKHKSSVLSSWLPFIMKDFRFSALLLRKHSDKNVKLHLRLPKLIIELNTFSCSLFFMFVFFLFKLQLHFLYFFMHVSANSASIQIANYLQAKLDHSVFYHCVCMCVCFQNISWTIQHIIECTSTREYLLASV